MLQELTDKNSFRLRDFTEVCHDNDCAPVILQLVAMWVKSQNAVANLSAIAHIALLAVASAAVLSNKAFLKCSRKSLMRSA